MSDIMRFSLFNVSLFNLRRSIQLILIKDSLPLITVGAVGTATFLHHLNLSPPQSMVIITQVRQVKFIKVISFHRVFLWLTQNYCIVTVTVICISRRCILSVTIAQMDLRWKQWVRNWRSIKPCWLQQVILVAPTVISWWQSLIRIRCMCMAP